MRPLQWDLFSLPWWTIMVALVFCTGIINAYNFMDGINGITGGYSLVVLISLAYVNETVVSFVAPELIYTTVCSVLVFNFFNFRKKAKCFAGDVGSVGIAFIILFVLGKLIIQTEDFTYVLFLAVYGVDSVLTIIHRIMLRENIGEAHRKHVYQLMANELQMPHVWVSSIYMVLQLIISAGLVSLPVNHWIYFCGVIVVLAIAYIVFKKKYYYLHEEYLKTKIA